MRYHPLPATFHAGRRQAFRRQLAMGTVAIIDTNPLLVRSRDTQMPFRPDSYFYYLSGIDQPEAVLVLSRDDEWLFIRETDAHMRLWDGEAYTRDEAATLSGMSQVAWTSELDGHIKKLLSSATSVQLNYSEPAAEGADYAPGALRARALRRDYPGLAVETARPLLADLRLIKQPEEIAQLQSAIALTATGFKRAKKALIEGRFEYEIEAEFTHEFMKGGASGHAYEPIVAAGAASTVLHSVRNDQVLRTGELVVVDVGAEYGWYAADITRTWPVGGRFSARQLAVYEAVLQIQRATIKLMKPGAKLADIERQVGQLVTDALGQLGVITAAQAKADPKLYRRYYPHAVSHFLGLDVHDVGDLSRPLEPGMVLTCEPGIYLADERIGVRLEDDILITASGNQNLSAKIPIKP